MSRWLLVFFLAALSGPTGAEGSASRPSVNELVALFDQLAGDAMHEREATEDRLVALGEQFPMFILQQAAGQYVVHQDVESRLRLEQVMKPLVLKLMYQRPAGFIGINMMWKEIRTPPHPAYHHGIFVSNVLEGFPGAAAGLQQDDLLLEVSGSVVAALGRIEGFARLIAETPPGTEVTLKVLRGDDVLDLSLTLGMRPGAAGQFVQGRPQSGEQFFEDWLNQLEQVSGVEQAVDFPVGHFGAP